MTENREHGNVGNRNAAKAEAENFSARIIFALTPDLKSKVVRAHQASGKKLAEWMREAAEEKLEREGVKKITSNS